MRSVCPIFNTSMLHDHQFDALYSFVRVWKGIFGIRNLTKIRCGNRENDKYLDGIRDVTAPPEAGLAKIKARGAGCFSPVRREFGKSSRPK